MTSPCPCGRAGTFGGALPYDRCCGRYLDDPVAAAPDPESLMRSRYTAFAAGRADYLLATWDAATRPARLDLDSGRAWTGLTVLEAREDGDAGEVTFVAAYRTAGGRTGEQRERSAFVRLGGRWYYTRAL